MNARTTILLASLALVARDADASQYQALKGEIDAYVPPALYQSLVAPNAAGRGAPAPAAGDAAFSAATAGVRKLEQEWGRNLAAGGADAAFLVPDPERLRALTPAAKDPEAAGRALADGFTLETLETLALLRSPMVAVKEHEARAALQAFGQAEQIDAVLRRYASLTPDAMSGFGGMERAPDFPFPSVLALKGEIVAAEVRGAREALEAARRDAVTMARSIYWELRYVGRAEEITTGMIELLNNLSASVSARYESGGTSFQDVVRVRIEREKAQEELKTLAQERVNQAAQIRSLLALPPEIAVGMPAAREAAAGIPDQKLLEALALERRQELRAADAMVARMERMLEMIETMTYPGFELGLSVRTGSMIAPPPAAGPDAMGAATTGGTGAPVRPFFGGDEAYVGEIRQRIAALKSERDTERAATLVGVRDAWFGLDRGRREAALYAERVVTLSQSALESALRGYAAGKVMFSDLLESYTGWLEANLASERARADVGSARARVEAAAGTSRIEAGQ